MSQPATRRKPRTQLPYVEPMAGPPLSERQKKVLKFITDFYITHGVPPTIRWIGKSMNINSPNGVLCHLVALLVKGKLRRISGGGAEGAMKFIPTGYKVVKDVGPAVRAG